jgi:ribosomal protein S18 acetylase RimI-like enzyme
MGQYTVRRATPDDREAVEYLIDMADRLVLYTQRSSVQRALDDQAFYLVEANGELGCVCGFYVVPETVAQVRVFGLLEGWQVSEALRELLPIARAQLGARGVTTLAFTGIEAWLMDGLVENGFRQTNAIVSLQKTDFYVPDEGNLDATVRPARLADFTSILDIDRAVFVPLWRNTEGTLTEYMSSCSDLSVAELDGTVIGYQCLNLIGRHGHVTRIAVHPDYHGRRIAVRLLAEAIRFFHSHRVYGITLNTQQDNHRARRLYDWFGFKVLGKEAQVMTLDVPCLSSETQV